MNRHVGGICRIPMYSTFWAGCRWRFQANDGRFTYTNDGRFTYSKNWKFASRWGLTAKMEMFTCKLGNLSKRQGVSKSHDAEDMWFLPNMKWKNTTWIWNNPTGVPTRPKWQVISRMAQLFGFAWNGTKKVFPLSYVCPMVFPWDVPMTYPEELAQAKARCWDAVQMGFRSPKLEMWTSKPWFYWQEMEDLGISTVISKGWTNKSSSITYNPNISNKNDGLNCFVFLQRDNFTPEKWGVSGYSVERRTWRLHQERSGRGVQRHCPFCRKMDHSKNDYPLVI